MGTALPFVIGGVEKGKESKMRKKFNEFALGRTTAWGKGLGQPSGGYIGGNFQIGGNCVL